jgi:hypothetical protein
MSDEEKIQESAPNHAVGKLKGTASGTSTVVGTVTKAPETNWWQRKTTRQRLLIYIGIAWGFIFVLAHTRFFYQFEIPGLDKLFAANFWPNLIADLGGGLFLAWLLGDVLDKASHYDLRLEIIVRPRNRDSSYADFYIVNNGQESFQTDQIKWNLFIEKEVNHLGLDEQKPEERDLFSIQYRHYHEVFNEPLFVGERVKIKTVFLTRKGAPTISTLYYYFSTGHGVRPLKVKLGSDGQALENSLPSIVITLPEDITQRP